MADLWTIDELTEQVAVALAQDPGQPSGRVREVPDRRAIRWYTTIGLVDRPAAMRGRTALYGRRHLLQIVGIKRRQAQGRSLASIQAELAGATDTVLETVARPADGDPPVVRRTFWTERPAAPRSAPRLATGIRLRDGVTLLLDAGTAPGPDDLRAIEEAARPLLDLLAQRGYTTEEAHP